ncbi:MAG TPA: hypothetical protein DD462_14800, partial [Leeuwenhoekiella sp.]|nr:hypothetical protein [Leeuwenhoekiella sp.]
MYASNTKLFLKPVFILFLVGFTWSGLGQQKQEYWHNKPRKIHYKPEGNAFVLVNGSRKFNR